MSARDLVAYSFRTMAPDFKSLASHEQKRAAPQVAGPLHSLAKRGLRRADGSLLLVLELRKLLERLLGAAGEGCAATARRHGQAFERHGDEMAA